LLRIEQRVKFTSRRDKRGFDLLSDAAFGTAVLVEPIAIGYKGERLKAFGTAFIICLCCAIRYLDFMGKKKKRGRPRIRTAEYWREYYTRKQREWRAAHPRTRNKGKARATR
jgi:hypothetical protein